MLLKNKGQSVLEYMLLASIIMVGIIIGGPILLKSVQGYFQLTDESVQDATSEIIQQAPDATNIPKICGCSNGTTALPSALNIGSYQAAGWSQGECGVGNCSALQRYFYRTCSPIKCAAEEACVPDGTCCSAPEPLSCGTRFSAGSATLNCTQAGKTKTTLDARFGGSYTNTCDLLSANGYDCLVGQRLYVRQCANAANPSTKDTIYACKGPDDETKQNCLPTCWQYPFPGSKPCNGPATGDAEKDDYMVRENALQDAKATAIALRTDLIPEVIYRQSATNSGDNPPNINEEPKDMAYYARVSAHLVEPPPHNPYRILTKNAETSDILKFNSYRAHYVYLKANQCADARYCERRCPGGYGPNPEGLRGMRENESCAQLACLYGWWPEIEPLPVAAGSRDTAKASPANQICDALDEPKICLPNTDICGYIAVCSSPSGYSYRTSDTSGSFDLKKLADSAAPCDTGYRKISDLHNKITYCYKATPSASPIAALPADFHCDAGNIFVESFGYPANAATKDNTLFFTLLGCDN